MSKVIFNTNRGISDIEYCSAQLLYHLIHKSNQILASADNKSLVNIFQFTGYGISTDFHGDIEYMYRIDKKLRVYKTTISDKTKKSDFKLIETFSIETGERI